MHFYHFSYFSPFAGTPVREEGLEKSSELNEPGMSKWGNAIPVFPPKDPTLSQLEEGMAWGREIMDRLSRKASVRGIRDAILKGDVDLFLKVAKRSECV